ncbi:MAG TPA: DUF4386 family protein [Anaerolineae bacterium]|jgi:hypothetical protein
MKGNSVMSLGGVCSIILGVITLLIGITYLLLPPEQKLGIKAVDLLPSFSANPTLLTLQSLELALAGVFGLAVVPAVAQLTDPVNEGWSRWVGTLAYVGFGVAAVSNMIVVARLPGIAAAFVAGDAATKAALAPVWRSTLDWQGIWQYGAIGVWYLVASLLLLRGNKLSKPFNYLGVVAAIVTLLVPLAFIIKVPVLFTVVAIAGGVLGVVWYIWLGLQLRKQTA